MENLKSSLNLIIVFAIVWHIKVGFSSDTKISGVFQVKPEMGYNWEKVNSNAYNPASHFFWEENKVIWCTGFVHPKFNVQAAETKNTWIALPGYVLTGTKDGDFSTMWKQGLSHPHMNAYSANIEGIWIAVLGYKFIMENGFAVGTTWASGTKYPEYKLIASDKTGVFNAYPGYTFPNPAKSLDVVWTPGLADPSNPNKISGTIEGDWIDYTALQPNALTWGDHLAISAATAGLANFGEWLFGGKNFISKELDKMSNEEFAKSVVTGFNKLTE
ncbi:MAG: hypothetical protein SF052_03195 [Bacteroidia bacterium]|nr:hypothetical protein [Bacteroidia bacterium]